MNLSKTFLVIITIVLFSVASFLTGIQFEKLTNKTNLLQTEANRSPQIPQFSQSPQLPQEATVVRVVDGDTVELESGQTVRIEGINTPEVNQPFHDQAAAFTQKLILNQKVRLEYEKGYEQDKFGRLLAYVFISNSPNNPNFPNHPKETLVNLELVKAGLAKVSIYEKRRPLIYQEQLLKAQEEAKQKNLNVWSSK